MSSFQCVRNHERRIGVAAQIPLLTAFLLGAVCLRAENAWTVVGPAGGDARALASFPEQPKHLLLGTTNSWLYETVDEGASWHRLAKLGSDDGFVLDSIVVDSADPATIYVGTWNNSTDGGLWISHDSGHSWSEPAQLKGQPVHALAQAPSDPSTLYAGTLEGVFRSSDGGATWAEISPPGSHEIHEIESLAVDPENPDTVYAGTWHLPWKTADGGKTWHNIKQGLIVDSDVFSIIVDPEHPHTVYLSACSGIYKSENAGIRFHKIQGIPSEARRTRSLIQDPEKRDVVYAGTTEGLYKTVNAGKTFKRMTDSDVVVNAVYVDPGDSNRVLLATDRGGVLASEDGGATFTLTNRGISERKVAAVLVDRDNPEVLYAGVVNDKKYGGVFRSSDGGAHWEQLGSGLDGRDVFALAETKDGSVVAGTSHGIFVLEAAGDPAAAGNGTDAAAPTPSVTPAANGASNGSGNGSAATPDGSGAATAFTWVPRNTIANTVTKTITQTHMHTKVNIEKQVQAPTIELQSPVNALDVSGDVWAAATGYGVVTSSDQGASWQGGPVMGEGDYLSVTVHADTMVAARADSVVISRDAGKSWWPMGLPTMLTRIHRVAFSPDGTLWLGAREGVYLSRDLGTSWMWVHRLPFRDVDDLSCDAESKRILVSSRTSDQVYAIDPKTMTWNWWQTGYQIVLIRAAGDRLVAASLNDGVLVGPELTAAANVPAAGASATP
ncbi:MAG: WD40/YVTN/BNR-like repeat-containing protein [Terracidiphilus sp.]